MNFPFWTFWLPTQKEGIALVCMGNLHIQGYIYTKLKPSFLYQGGSGLLPLAPSEVYLQQSNKVEKNDGKSVAPSNVTTIHLRLFQYYNTGVIFK